MLLFHAGIQDSMAAIKHPQEHSNIKLQGSTKRITSLIDQLKVVGSFSDSCVER